MPHRPCFITVLLLAACPLLAEDYEVRVHRPLAVNQQGREAGYVTLDQKVFLVPGGEDAPFHESFVKVEFDLEWKILETGKLGGATRIETNVHAITKIGEAIDSDILPKGTRIVSRLEKTRMVHESKETLPPEVLMVLDNIVTLEVEGIASPEEVWAVKGRKKVGDKWSFHIPAVVKTMAAMGMKVSEKDMTVEAKLATVEERGKVRCTVVETTTTIKSMTAAQDNLPPGMKMTGGSAVVTSKTWLPLDPTLPEAAAEAEEKLDWNYENADGKMRALTTVKKAWTAKAVK